MFLKRRHLGRPSKDSIDNEKKVEEVRKRPIKLFSNETVMCGIYKRDTELKAHIVHYYDMDDFWIKNLVPTINLEERKLMDTVTSIKLASGSPMYEARVYATEPGQIKLFRDQHGGMLRCQVKHLFTYNINGVLYPFASIRLVDTGEFLREVPLSDLFDIPQRINFYSEIEWGAKPARIHLGESVPLDFQDGEICRYALDKISNSPGKQFTIKILDYRDGIYHVDLISKNGKSLVEHLRAKFSSKLAQFDQPKFSQPTYSRGRKQDLLLSKPKYNSITSYYKKIFQNINVDYSGTLFYQKTLIQVKIINWTGPEGINIIPNDIEYSEDHRNFMRELNEYQTKREKQLPQLYQTYAVGQRCIYYNGPTDALSTWMRGTVVETPEGVKPGDWTNCVYRIRSFDYGNEVLKNPTDMREISEDNPFLSLGPWSLRCRLFGVHPLEVDGTGAHVHSSLCKNMMDVWIRGMMADQGDYNTSFYALFKDNILKISDNWCSDDEPMDINIFYRFDFVNIKEDCMRVRRRKPRYDCLNSFLIERGVAGDCNLETGQRSKLDIDEYIVNLMVLPQQTSNHC